MSHTFPLTRFDTFWHVWFSVEKNDLLYDDPINVMTRFDTFCCRHVLTRKHVPYTFQLARFDTFWHENMSHTFPLTRLTRFDTKTCPTPFRWHVWHVLTRKHVPIPFRWHVWHVLSMMTRKNMLCWHASVEIPIQLLAFAILYILHMLKWTVMISWNHHPTPIETWFKMCVCVLQVSTPI